MKRWFIVDRNGEVLRVLDSEQKARDVRQEDYKPDTCLIFAMDYEFEQLDDHSDVTAAINARANNAMQMAFSTEAQHDRKAKRQLNPALEQALFMLMQATTKPGQVADPHRYDHCIAEVLVPGTDLSINLMNEPDTVEQWWLLGAGGEKLWVIDQDIAMGLMAGLAEWLKLYGEYRR